MQQDQTISQYLDTGRMRHSRPPIEQTQAAHDYAVLSRVT
jgi:hypothetical protein